MSSASKTKNTRRTPIDAIKKKARSSALRSGRTSAKNFQPKNGLYLGRLGIALGLATLMGWGALRIVTVKTAQHVTLDSVVPLVPQGVNPGNLSGPTAIKADGHGGVVTLSAVGPFWRVQHFDANMALMDHEEILVKEVGELSDLAVQPDGICLAGGDGSLWRLDSRLRPLRHGFKVETGRPELRSLDQLPDGRLLALDISNALLLTLNAQGKVLQEIPVPAARDAYTITLVPEGVAWLEFDGDSVWVRVVDLGGRTLRRFTVQGVSPNPTDRVAASGGVLIINDSLGTQGVVFYSVQGRPLGNTVSMNSKGFISVLNSPGFVAGDPAGGVAYIHYGDGLLKVRLPWKGIL